MIDQSGIIKINGNINTFHCTRHVGAIKQLMTSVLEPHDITHFHHMRMFHNGSHIAFCNRPELIEYAYNSGWFHKSEMFQNNLSHCLTEFILWPKQAPNLDAHHFAVTAESFNVSHGISIIERAEEFVDFFHFGTYRENINFESFCLTQLPILKSIIFFYKDKAAKIIKTNKDNHVYKPYKTIDLNKHIDTHKANAALKSLNALESINRYYIEDFYITKKELKVIRLLAKGLSAKEIGQITNLSFKTIEYTINALKDKFKCKKVTELIAKSYQHYLLT